jgi:2-C-methyl-D-erythritol 4-phosphate cytidylyltransferase/2-C-methyl-D-erythritol 2,4-cyclodiphosphate synthase
VAERRVSAIVLAAGSGSRLGSDEPKALLAVGGVPMVVRAVQSVATIADEVVVAAPPGSEERVREALAAANEVRVVTGGSTRQASVRAGLMAVSPGCEIIVVHDGARPFATTELAATVVSEVVRGNDGAVPVVAIPDTVKRVRGGQVVATEDRSELGLAQTPQAFRASVLREAHARAEAVGLDLTDDAALVEWAGHRVAVVPGEPGNFKITTMADLERAGTHG